MSSNKITTHTKPFLMSMNEKPDVGLMNLKFNSALLPYLFNSFYDASTNDYI